MNGVRAREPEGENMEKIRINHKFHNTHTNLIPRDGVLSVSQVNRARRELCGLTSCGCGIGWWQAEGYEIVEQFDGSAILERRYTDEESR